MKKTSLLLGAISFALAAGRVESQSVDSSDARSAVVLVLGKADYDLSGTGRTSLIGMRFSREISRWAVSEGGLSLVAPRNSQGDRSMFIIPEVQFQVQLAKRVVKPYVGVGGGGLVSLEDDGSRLMVSGAAGVRLPGPSPHIDLAGELRVRGIGTSLSGSMTELTVGFAYRF